MKRARINHRATFKAQLAVAAPKVDKTLAESAKQFSVYLTQSTGWKQRLLTRAADVFGGPKPPSDSHAALKDVIAKKL